MKKVLAIAGIAALSLTATATAVISHKPQAKPVAVLECCLPVCPPHCPPKNGLIGKFKSFFNR